MAWPLFALIRQDYRLDFRGCSHPAIGFVAGAVYLRRGSLPVPARRIPSIAYFWPGLPQLWIRGSWAGLLVAVGFTALANVLLLATLVYGEWLSAETRLIGLGMLVAVWLLARWQSRAERLAFRIDATDNEELNDEEATDRPPAERDLLFREAQGHYLSNDWVAAEQTLLRLLKQDARDVESRLMLATLWRHQGRNVEAQRQLDRIERLDAASNWQHEIAAERMAIEIANNETNEEQEPEDPQRSDAPLERTEEQTTETTEHRKAA